MRTSCSCRGGTGALSHRTSQCAPRMFDMSVEKLDQEGTYWYFAVDVPLVGFLNDQIDKCLQISFWDECVSELRSVPEHYAVGDQWGWVLLSVLFVFWSTYGGLGVFCVLHKFSWFLATAAFFASVEIGLQRNQLFIFPIALVLQP